MLTYLSDVGYVRTLPHKGGSNEIDVIGQTPLHQVFLIFACQRWQVYDDTWQVDILALPGASPTWLLRSSLTDNSAPNEADAAVYAAHAS